MKRSFYDSKIIVLATLAIFGIGLYRRQLFFANTSFLSVYRNTWRVVTVILSLSRIFHSFKDVSIAGEGMQSLTYTPRTNDPHMHLMPSVWQLWSFRYLYQRPRSVAAVIRTPNLPINCGANALTDCATAAASSLEYIYKNENLFKLHFWLTL